MMDDFEYNCPQFDFVRGNYQDEENVEAYFEVDHENIKTETITNGSPIQKEGNDENLNFYSPMCSTPGATKTNEYVRPKLRKSLSVSNIHIEEKLENEMDTVSTNLKEKLNITADSEAQPMISNNLRKTSKLGRSMSRENLNRLAQPKRKFSSIENLKNPQYISMAEAIRKFQNVTPQRYHTNPKPDHPKSLHKKLTITQPQSPALLSKKRNRPVFALSREEQEELEFKEAQKFKIKSHPVKKTGPMKAQVPVERKPVTKPEPFNLTQARPKVQPSPKKEFQFHANPIPKSVLEPKKPIETVKQLTVPKTPSFMKNCPKKSTVLEKFKSEEDLHQAFKPSRTKPEPFSFERRDQQIQKRREDLINKVLEEEKKAREFHARPVPKNVLKAAGLKRDNSLQSLFSNTSKGSSKSEENVSETSTFKARPATVLYTKPFEPKREPRPLIEINAFTLNTDRRAKEREEFERKMKEKEEFIAFLKQQDEEKRLKEEEEEIARLKKETEFKANPIKKYKEVVIIPSQKVTEPISPKFLSGRNGNKENLTG